MHPPFKSACTKRLVALAKKAAIRVFFLVFFRSVNKHNKRYGGSGLRAHLSGELSSEDSFEETTPGYGIHDSIPP